LTDNNRKKKENIIRRLYNWVLSWAEKPSAQVFLFGLAFAEASFFPVPTEVLLIPLVFGARTRWFRLALITTVGSFLGGSFGYFIGWKLWWSGDAFTPLANFFFDNIPGFTQELFLKLGKTFQENNFLIVFTAGFTPIPYKIFTISAGAFKANFWIFLFASVVSRGARFFIIAYLIKLFGEPVKEFIDKYFNWLAILAAVLLIGGFLAIKYLF
jgi:membrane protein YqaA with SNARE-associated domain